MATLMTAMLTLLNNDLDDNWSSTTTAVGDTAQTYLVDDSLYEKVADWVCDGMILYLPLGPTGAGSAETRVVDRLDGNKLYAKTVFSAQVQNGVSYEVHRLFTRNQKLTALRNAPTFVCPEIHEVVRNMDLVKIIENQYEYDISSLGIFNNRPHQVLIAQQTIRDKWEADKAYVLDDYVRPATLAKFTGYEYKCTTAGTSDATTEPTWPTTIGDTVTDGTVVWTCQETLDYSNYPMLPLHDWDITPDGKLFLNDNYTAGYWLMIVGIKPLAFTGSGASESIALDSPFTLILSAQAALYLCQQRIGSAGTQNIDRWTGLIQRWQQELALRKVQYPMPAPAGTLITGGGLTV